MRIRLAGFGLALFLAAATIPAQTKDAVPPATAKKARILVLGVFHMANPGRDLFNLQVDDVLTPKRQKELNELAAALKNFQPTKIAIEAPVGARKSGNSTRTTSAENIR